MLAVMRKDWRIEIARGHTFARRPLALFKAHLFAGETRARRGQVNNQIRKRHHKHKSLRVWLIFTEQCAQRAHRARAIVDKWPPRLIKSGYIPTVR